MSSDAKFALVWIAFTALMWVALIPMVVWAVRTRQFSSQDRARRLALRSGPPEEVTGNGSIDKGVDEEDGSDGHDSP